MSVHGVCPAKGFPQFIDHLQSHDLLAIGSRGVDGIYMDILYIKWGYKWDIVLLHPIWVPKMIHPIHPHVDPLFPENDDQP